MSKWHSNPWTLGSYSHVDSREDFYNRNLADILAEPEANGKVLFAGEVTSYQINIQFPSNLFAGNKFAPFWNCARGS